MAESLHEITPCFQTNLSLPADYPRIKEEQVEYSPCTLDQKVKPLQCECSHCNCTTLVKKEEVREVDGTEVCAEMKPKLECVDCGNKRLDQRSPAELCDSEFQPTKKKLYECTLCKLKTTRAQNFNRHMRTHSGARPFQCHLCDYSASQRGTLVAHIRTHTKEKPFKCKQCDYIGSQKTNLDRHVAVVHTGLDASKFNYKVFQCSLCDYKSCWGNRTRHMRTHSGDKPFACDACSYKTGDRGDFKKHMAVHSCERPFCCAHCGYTARRRSHLRSHYNHKHPRTSCPP